MNKETDLKRRTMKRGFEIGVWDFDHGTAYKGKDRSKLYQYPEIYLKGYNAGFYADHEDLLVIEPLSEVLLEESIR